MSGKRPCAEIIAIGSEFLHGGRIESNSLFLAEGLAKSGVEVRWKTLVGDDVDQIVLAIKTAVRRAFVVVLTGGLGSTLDDCTRKAVSQVTGKALRCRSRALAKLQTLYALRGRSLTKIVSRQAYLPVGSQMLDNPVGSAPGFLLEWKGRLLLALPGVAKEARAMFEAEGYVRIAARVAHSAHFHVLEQKVLSTFGLTELEIDDRLQLIFSQASSVEYSLLASTLGVTVAVRQWIREQRGKREFNEIDRLVPLIRHALGDHVYAEGRQSMEEVVGTQLKSAAFTLSLAESCTGGLVSHRLTQVPGSSAYLDRAFVCYSNQAKEDFLGVPDRLLRRHGAVSAPVARAMAVGARNHSRSDVALSVTGIAGPGGGSARKPVGLVFLGIDGAAGTYTKKLQLFGDRQDVKIRASQAALNYLRLYLLGRP
ncbi:MAG: CinA family nicotinamide mononucleotide deamidase-related protein [Nitrospirales bacterium]|nr:CinA family nicotinamide mononucleotide deamidase-related protein [Nitrospira sp.]MDR4502851.1 CinA family nicotinamide mononucleotide deamidase-related protein [Nitrospirales bacterium]